MAGRGGLKVLGRGLLGAVLVFSVAGQGARGQGVAPVESNPVHVAPGLYGTSWGTASYGLKRTYSEFASSYGPGYGTGYAPYGFLPGPYGAGLWRPGQKVLHGGPNQYRTFAVPYVPGSTVATPPFGLYAPAFGPGGSGH